MRNVIDLIKEVSDIWVIPSANHSFVPPLRRFFLPSLCDLSLSNFPQTSLRLIAPALLLHLCFTDNSIKWGSETVLPPPTTLGNGWSRCCHPVTHM